MYEALKKLNAKQYQEAHGLSFDMIKRDVNDPRPYYVLGRIAFEHQNIVKAKELYTRACQLDEKNATYLTAYAQVHSVLGQQNEAREAAEQAGALPVDDPLTADTLGVIFSRAGFHERAIPFFKRAIDLNPAPANFHYNLGSSLQFSGRFPEAKAAYQAAIDRDAAFFKAFTGLVGLEKQTVERNQLETLLELFEKHRQDSDASLHIGHALAKSYEDMGKYDTSLKWLKRAKTLNRERFPVDTEAQKALFDAARATSCLDQPSDANTDAPIFVVGLPRTGTTLVDRILSSHPDVIGAGELNVFAALVKAAAGTGENLVLDAPTLAAVQTDDLASIGTHYINSTKALSRGAPRFTDKMPLNFFYAALILKALPNARIVALRRDPMDSCLSNYRQLFSTQYSYYNYTYDLENTARFYRDFDGLMAHWRRTLPKDRFMEIAYEDIVFDQETQTRRLLEFCDLDWNEACLRFHENVSPVSTASSVQVRQPLYSGSIGRWQRYGEGLEPLKATLGDLVR